MGREAGTILTDKEETGPERGLDAPRDTEMARQLNVCKFPNSHTKASESIPSAWVEGIRRAWHPRARYPR